ncbi:MAG: TonB family protein [Longimicrobiales bacterium]
MIAWILYSLLVATLMTVGAHAADRVLRLQGLPTRWIWVLSLVASLLIPAVWPQLPRSLSVAPAPTLIPSTFSVELDAITSVADAAPFWTVPRFVLAGWLALSVILLSYGVYAVVRLRAARTQWRAGEVSGEEVLISENVGPAVVGLVEPVVVVPEWIESLSSAEQRLVLAHERAHISARDPWLIVFSQLLPALMPWNVPVWWQARRLREALELDCDARVLAGVTTPHRYAELLLCVGQRTSGLPLAVAALSESRSLLEKRIRRMFERRPRHRLLHATGWATMAGVAVLAAFRAPLPGQPLPGALAPVDQPVNVAPALAVDTLLPKLLNPVDVQEATRRYYTASLRDASIEGTPHVSVHITDAGEVAIARLRQSSGNEALDQAALRVAGVMRFVPARFNDRPIPIWFDVAIEFSRHRLSRPHPDEIEAVRVARRAEMGRAVEAVISERRNPPPGSLATVAVPAGQRTAAPELANRNQLQEEITRAYPSTLRASGVGGRVTLSLFVDEAGQVGRMQVKSSSGVQELDDAALRAASVMRFRPAQNQERNVGAWIEMPIDFQAAVPERMPIAAAARQAQVEAGPVFTPYTLRPGLRNGDEVSRALQRYYPPLLRDAGVGGTVNLWFFIDETGKVIKTQIKQSSGHEALDQAAQLVAQSMVFSPAQNRDQLVRVWVDMPIVFKSHQPEASAPRVEARMEEPVRRPGTATTGTTVTTEARARTVRRGEANVTVATTATVQPRVVPSTVAEASVATTEGRRRAAPAIAHGIVVPEQPSLSRITNADEVARALQRYYPPLLRDAGIGGVVKLTILVDTDGTPLKVELRESSGHDALDQAALRVAAITRFAPTGAPGPISATVPITFKTQ